MSDRRVAIVLAVVAAAALLAFGWGAPTDYDYHGRLASALLQGRWWLEDAPSWLNELLACGAARWCVAYPPLPAVLSLPFAVFARPAVAQGLMSQLAAGASAGVLFLALRAIGVPRRVALAGVALSAFGTTLLFSAADARAWFAAHSVAVLFTSLALLLAATGRPLGVGAAIGLAALARLPVVGAVPGLALLAATRADRAYLPTLARVAVAGAPFALLYVGYNLLRWGTVFDAGYVRLTEDDAFFNHGLFSPLYLPRHLYAIFMEPPELVEGTWAFLRLRIVGMSLFLTTPAFLWLFAGLRHARRDVTILACAIAAAGALLPDVLHGTVGFAQFGYRFSLDAQPFLIVLALAGDALIAAGWKRRPSVLFLVAIAVAVAINVYAAIAIIRFGYWT